MNVSQTLLRFALPPIAAIALASCSGGGASGGTPQQVTVGTFSTRVVNGSPDLGAIDIYIYSSTGSQPAQPIIANLQYPSISSYVAYPNGAYTVAIDKAGTTTQIGSAQLSGTTTGGLVTTAVVGEVANASLQLDSFIEPSETSGTSNLILHDASPAANAALNNFGLAVYQANGSAAPAASGTTQVAAFVPPTSNPGGSTTTMPATTGGAVTGEFFVTPIPATYPSPIGFAIGAAGSGSQLTSVLAFASLSGSAAGGSTLAQNTSNTIPAGAHVSVFAVDSTTSAPAIIIGTLDP